MKTHGAIELPWQTNIYVLFTYVIELLQLRPVVPLPVFFSINFFMFFKTKL